MDGGLVVMVVGMMGLGRGEEDLEEAEDEVRVVARVRSGSGFVAAGSI